MGRFQVFRKSTVEGTHVEVYVSSIAEHERRGIADLAASEDSMAAICAILAKHAHPKTDAGEMLFQDGEQVAAELSPGQVNGLFGELMAASGLGGESRFRDGGGEAGGVQPDADG